MMPRRRSEPVDGQADCPGVSSACPLVSVTPPCGAPLVAMPDFDEALRSASSLEALAGLKPLLLASSVREHLVLDMTCLAMPGLVMPGSVAPGLITGRGALDIQAQTPDSMSAFVAVPPECREAPSTLAASADGPSSGKSSSEGLPAIRAVPIATLPLRSISPVRLKDRADQAGGMVDDHEQVVCAWSIRETLGSEARFRHWVKRLSSAAGFDLTRYSPPDEGRVGPEIRFGEFCGLTSFAVERAEGVLLAMIVRPVGASRTKAGVPLDGIPIGMERLQFSLRQTPPRDSIPAGVEASLLISRRALPGLFLGPPDLPRWAANVDAMPARASDVDAAFSIWMSARGAIASAVQERLLSAARPAARMAPAAPPAVAVAPLSPLPSLPPAAVAPIDAPKAGPATLDRSAAILESLLETQDRELKAGKAEIVGARAEIHQLCGQIDALGDEVLSLRSRLARQRPAFTCWDDIWEWVRVALAGQIVIAPRAIVSASKSSYRNYAFAADVIALLANEYRDMRLGSERARERCEARRDALRVRISHVGAALENPRHRERYTVVYAGRRHTLDHHVCGSSSRDRARGFRCYFRWEEESRMALIGALPDHLDNSRS